MRNLTFKAAMLNDSRTTVNRQSTDGQSQRHYKQTPLSKRWKVLMTLVFLFTFAIGNVWGATGDPEVFTFPTSKPSTFVKQYSVPVTSAATSCITDGKIYFESYSPSNVNSVYGVEANYLGVTFKPTADCVLEIEAGNDNSSAGSISITGYSLKDARLYALYKAAAGEDMCAYLIENASADDKTFWKNNAVLKESKGVYSADGSNAAKVFSGQTTKTAIHESVFTQTFSVKKKTENPTTGMVIKTNADTAFVFRAGTEYTIYAHRSSSKIGFKKFTFKPVYRLTWDLDGGTITSAEDAYSNAGYYAKGTTLTAPTVEKTGADFTGWSPTVSTMPAVATTYKATWATACTAGVPGNVTKGALSADKITLTAEGSAADGDTWYWQTSEDGVDKSNSGSTYQASAAGTYYVRSFNSTANCWNVTAKSITLSADDFKAKYAITYDKGASGTGEIAAGEKTEGVDFTLSSDMFTRNNYLQVGWTKTDGTSREYMMGGKYTTDAAQKFYPAWAEKDTYVAAFHYDSENPTTPPAGWTFANAGTYTNTSATVAYVGKFTAEGETTASGKGMDPNHIAFAKNADADAVYDLGYVTTVSAVAGTLMIGSTSAKVASIDYLAADGSTVLHSFNITHNKADWGANNFNETEVVPNVRYIRINGKDFWQVLGAFSVTYGSLVPKYDLAFAKNGGSGADMTTLRYAEDAVVTLPGCTFTAPTNKTFDAWVVTKTASGNPITVTDGKFTMPAEAVTATATWKFLPKLTLTAGEGAAGEDEEAYYAAGTQISVPEKPADFSNGTKEFTGWVYSQETEVTAGKFAMPATDLTLTAQWASAAAVAQILGGDSYETFADAIAAVAAGQTIQLLADCSYDAAWNLTLAGTVTLDLNGHDLAYTGSGRGVQVHNGAKLVLEDGTATVAPTIDLTADPLSRSAITYTSGTFDSKDGMCALAGGEIEINSGTYLATEGVVLVAGNAATVTVNDGVLISRDNGVLMGNGTNSADFRNYVINVHGGILLGEIVSTGYASMVIYHPNVGELNIDGGTLVSTNGPAVVCRGGESNITGGTIVAQGSGSGKCGDASLVLPAVGVAYDFKSAYPGVSSFDAKISGDANVSGAAGAVKGIYAGTTPTTAEEDAVAISGGTFNSPVAQALCAENYAPMSWTDGTGTHYGVKPLAQSIDMEQFVLDNGKGGNWHAYLDSKGYTYAASNMSLDSLDGDKTKNNYQYLGLKFNKNSENTFVAGTLPANKLMIVKVGAIGNNTYMKIDGAKVTEPAIVGGVEADSAAAYTYWYYDTDKTFSLFHENGGTSMLKAITITDPYVVTYNANGGDEVDPQTFYGTALILPSATKGTEVFKGWYDAAEGGNLIGKAGESYTPTADVTLHAQWEAVSSDATLSALEVDEATVAGFDPETYIYNIVCEYGLQPTITKATATAGALATVTINNTPVDEGTYKYVQVKVVPQSGEEDQKFYQVRYTNLPKKGVSLIKATHTGAKTADVTGYLGGTYDKNTANDGKLGDANTYFGIKLTEGNFQAGDVLYIHASTVSSAVRIYSDKGTTRINAEDGTFDANKMFTYTLTAETEWIYIYRKVKDGESDMNPYVDYIEVQRHMDPFIAELKVGDALATIDEEANPKTITIEVPASTDITALTPSIKAYANGGATVTPADPQDFGAGAVEYTVTSYYGETTTYQVTVTKAEASHDATLSALSVAGYSLSPAFDPAVLTYNVELPKGSVIGDLPAVSYTLNHVGATAVKTDAAALPGATTIVVTAEDGLEENKKTYTINFTVSTKDKVVIFDGSTMDAFATSPDASGLSWELVGLSVSEKTIGSYTHAVNTGGSTSNSKHIKISVPAKYEAQFEIGQATNSNTKERNALVKTTAKPGDSETLFTVSSSNASEATVATSGALAGGKDYYLHSDNSINFVKIVAYLDRVSEAPAISAQPAALAVCDAATNTNALSVTASVDAGTLSYQWYKVVEEGDDVAVGTNSNEFVPTAVGEYYVVVTNTEGTYKPSSKKSEVVAVSLKPAVEITTAPLNQRAEAGNNATLTVVAANAVNYAWYTCDEDGSNADAVDGASGADKTSLVVAVTEGLQQYYKVVVTDDCGRTDEAIAKVSQFVPATPANVTESIVWDWTSSAWPASGEVQFTNKVADGTDFSKDYELLANADAIVPNNEGFRSDMLYGKGQYVWRSGNKFFQGTAIKFTTEVAGLVRINYRSTGNNKEVQVTIAGTPAGKNKTSDFQWSEYVEVPAGAVEILCLSTDANKSLTRVQKIEFLAVGHERAGLVVGDLGTVCLPNASIARGVTVYEYQGADEIGKIVFDELGANELLEAGKPYIFQVKETNARFYYNTDPAVATPDNSTALKGNLGAAITFQPGSAEAANVYFVKDHAFWMAKNTGVKIGQYRAYLQMNEVTAVTSSAPAPGRRRISMAVNGEQVATGIENTGFESEAPRKVLINGELYIIRGEKMYDAKGQLVK